MYREESCAIKVKLLCESIRMRWSSRLVESESFGGKLGGYMGEERDAGTFIISYFFLGGGGVSCKLSIGD